MEDKGNGVYPMYYFTNLWHVSHLTGMTSQSSTGSHLISSAGRDGWRVSPMWCPPRRVQSGRDASSQEHQQPPPPLVTDVVKKNLGCKLQTEITWRRRRRLPTVVHVIYLRSSEVTAKFQCRSLIMILH